QAVERQLVDLLEVDRTRHGLRQLVQHAQHAELLRRHGPGTGLFRLAESFPVSRPGSLAIRLPRQAHDPNPAVAVLRPRLSRGTLSQARTSRAKPAPTPRLGPDPHCPAPAHQRAASAQLAGTRGRPPARETTLA